MEHFIQLFLLAAKPQANVACPPKLTVSYGSLWSAYAAAAAALNRTCHKHTKPPPARPLLLLLLLPLTLAQKNDLCIF